MSDKPIDIEICNLMPLNHFHGPDTSPDIEDLYRTTSVLVSTVFVKRMDKSTSVKCSTVQGILDVVEVWCSWSWIILVWGIRSGHAWPRFAEERFDQLLLLFPPDRLWLDNFLLHLCWPVFIGTCLKVILTTIRQLATVFRLNT